MSEYRKYFNEAADLLQSRTWYRGPGKTCHKNPSACLWTAIGTTWARYEDFSYYNNTLALQAIAKAIREIDPRFNLSPSVTSTVHWNDKMAKRKKDVVAVLRRAGELYGAAQSV